MLTGIIGQASLRLLLVAVAMGFFFHIGAVWKRTPRWRRLSKLFMWIPLLFALVSSAALIRLLITVNLSYAYVVEYASKDLQLVYRIAAFWGGNQGSLLLWVLVLTFYGMIVTFSTHEDSDRMLPVVSLLMTGLMLFYALVLNVAADPFVRLAHPAASGGGLSPLLQNPGMTVHPVNLYLGYIGFSVPFAYGMAGLLLKKTDATWLTVTRRWTLISWLFLSIGIVYGAHWSYEELGWGGYWAWDPIENASLLPWLTGTAFLHSAVVQEKRGMLKGWNVVLVSLTFLLTLLGTYLTRSGVLWSIHAFANSILGNYFLAFLTLTTVFSLSLIVVRWPTLKADRNFEAVVSKESGFLLNNLLFLGSAFAVLWGTVFPLISEGVLGKQLMVSEPFYNAVNLPLGVCIVLLMGIGPLVAWKRASMKSIVRTVMVPLAFSLGVGIVAAAVLKHLYGRSTLLGTLAIVAATFVAVTVFLEFAKSVAVRVDITKEPWLTSLVRLIGRNRRRYGGYVVHLAVAIMAIGIAGSGAYHVDLQQTLKVGQSAEVGPYRLTFDGMGLGQTTDKRVLYANMDVHQGNHDLGVIRPAVTFYTNGQSPSTDVALYSNPIRDLYVVMLGTANGNAAVFDMHVNPLVAWIWYGGYLFIAGTLMSLWPESFRRKQSQSALTGLVPGELDTLYRSLAEAEYDFHMGKLDQQEYEANKAEFTARIDDLERSAATTRAQLVAEVEQTVRQQRLPQHGNVGDPT